MIKFISISIFSLFFSQLASASEATIHQWTDKQGVENYADFLPDEYGVVRQDDTRIDYGQLASKAMIKRHLVGTWNIPKYLFGGIEKGDVFEQGSIVYHEDGRYEASYRTAKGFSVKAEGGWLISRDNYLKIRGVVTIGIQQTSFSQRNLIRYIDNTNLVSSDLSNLSFQYIKAK
jgi:hypothetical protein